MSKIKVLIVDDAVVMRRIISSVIENDPRMEVVGKAANGKIAVSMITQVNPDIVTMDIEMPVMGGVEAVREIRKTHPNLPIIMFSTLTTKGGEATFSALAAGATDYVAKPSNIGSFQENISILKRELLPRMRSVFPTLDSLIAEESCLTLDRKVVRRDRPRGVFARPKLLCIGTSTGGPNALWELFESIKNPLEVPCLIVQHMPPMFTKLFAERLNRMPQHECVEAKDGQLVRKGCVYIAPGGHHMELEKEDGVLKIRLHQGPPENSCRPAVDVLFRSVARTCGSATLGVILTGMGMDGFRGSEEIFERNGRLLAQDSASSVVWGMPSYIAKNGLAEEILPLSKMGEGILRRLSEGMPTRDIA